MKNLYDWKQIIPAKFFAVVTIFSLLLSAFPAAFFVAEAQELDGGELSQVTNDPPPGHDKVFICHWSEEDEEFKYKDVPKTSIGVAHGGAGGNDGDIIRPFDDYPGQNHLEDYGGMTGAKWLEDGKCPPRLAGSISGDKFQDLDGDGASQEEGEPELPDWTIRLYEVGEPWVLVNSDVTDEFGEYEFVNVPAGEYKVCEVMKDDWVQKFVTTGTDNLSPNAFEEGPKCQTVTIDKYGEKNPRNFGNYYEETVDYCDSSKRPGGMSIAQWHEANDFDGTDCFEYEVVQQCGSLDVQFITNETGLGFEFNYVIGSETPVNFEDGSTLPVNFDEDENGGSVEVTYYVVGPESDFFVGSDLPNFWNGNGTTVLVDTDCKEPEPVCEIGENLLENGSFEDPVVTDDKKWRYTDIIDWVITALSDDEPQDGELHRGWSGNQAADGEQYAELDSRESVKMSQTVATEEGATYELKWAFAPRHGIVAEQNQLAVLIDGSIVATHGPATASAGLDLGDWTRKSYSFEATGDETMVTFSDAGPSDSYGTFLDDAALCFVSEPQCEPERYVFADNAENNDQGLTKGGAAVAVNRSNPEDAIGDPDWTSGGSSGFYSLGFGGWIVVSFDKYVVNVDGDDLSVHEATNGRYPEETASVEVSQNGSDWYLLSEEATNLVDEGGDGVTLLDFEETGLDWIKYVRLTDTSDASLHSNSADGFDLDTVDATYVVCDEPEQKTTIVAHKIVCTDESELPNYGKGGPNMTANTAQDWVDSHDSCSLEPGWEFQWGPTNAPDTDDDFVGEAGGLWNTFGPTNEDGKATVELSEDDIEGNKHLWLREVLQEGYIPFSHQDDNSNNTDFSAEVYCHIDVLNFDNRDRIDSIEAGETYYCVAWNVPAEPEQCELDIYSDTGTLVEDTNEYAVATYDGNKNWTANIPGATWIWATDQVENPESNETYTFVETFIVENPTEASITIAHDNWLKFYVNGTLVDDRTGTNGYQDFQKQTYDILSELVPGENRMEIEITNQALDNSDYRSNPAGTLFHLSALGDAKSCDRTTEPEEKKVMIDGYKFAQETDFIYGVPGWTIELRDSEGELVTSTTTDENGYYWFDDLVPGNYEVHEVVPSGWYQMSVYATGGEVTEDFDINYCLFEIGEDYQSEDSREVGYDCDFYNEEDEEDEEEEERRGGGGSSATRVAKPTPSVAGASTMCPFLEDYMQIGWENDSFEVMKLQIFLNVFKDLFGGTTNPVTGVFGAITDSNVKAFQEQYHSEILNPWFDQGIVPHHEPTGFVYKTTLWKINDIVCPDWEPYPSLDGESLNENVDLNLNEDREGQL